MTDNIEKTTGQKRWESIVRTAFLGIAILCGTAIGINSPETTHLGKFVLLFGIFFFSYLFQDCIKEKNMKGGNQDVQKSN